MSAAFCIIYSNKKGKKDDVATMGHGGKITQTKKGHLVKKKEEEEEVDRQTFEWNRNAAAEAAKEGPRPLAKRHSPYRNSAQLKVVFKLVPY
jgi:hypothetical protein